MTLQNIRKLSTRFAFWLAAVVMLSAANHTAWAQQGQQDDFPALPQSTDVNNPVRITTRSFSGELKGSRQDYFYSFTAGPGQVTLTLVVVSDGNSTQAVVDLFDQTGSPLLANFAARGTTNGEPASQMVTVAARQSIILRVRDGNGNQGIFGVQLDGTVEVGQASPAPGPLTQPGGYPGQAPNAMPPNRPNNVQLKLHTKKHGTFTVTFNVRDHRQPQSPGTNQQ